MAISALQKARAAYQPKLPKAFKGGVVLKEGKATQSVADQDEIKKLFPNTYGMPIVTFEEAASKLSGRLQRRCDSFRRSGPRRSQRHFWFVRRNQINEQKR